MHIWQFYFQFLRIFKNSELPAQAQFVAGFSTFSPNQELKEGNIILSFRLWILTKTKLVEEWQMLWSTYSKTSFVSTPNSPFLLADLMYTPSRVQFSYFLSISSHISLFYTEYWRRKWQPTPVFLPRKSHGQSWSLVGYSPWGCKE